MVSVSSRACVLLVPLFLLACDKPEVAAKATPEVAAKTTPEPASEAKPAPVPSDAVLDHEVELLDGKTKSLADYRGKTLLVVNVASECGFTPQYAQLQELQARYADKGFEVLAFPSNDFGGQEPGTPEEIQAFVDANYSVEFEMFEKVATAGAEQAPLYKTLTEETGEGISGPIAWNFTKFLVAPDGRVLQRFEPPVKPTAPELITALEQVLAKN